MAKYTFKESADNLYGFMKVKGVYVRVMKVKPSEDPATRIIENLKPRAKIRFNPNNHFISLD